MRNSTLTRPPPVDEYQHNYKKENPYYYLAEFQFCILIPCKLLLDINGVRLRYRIAHGIFLCALAFKFMQPLFHLALKNKPRTLIALHLYAIFRHCRRINLADDSLSLGMGAITLLYTVRMPMMLFMYLRHRHYLLHRLARFQQRHHAHRKHQGQC